MSAARASGVLLALSGDDAAHVRAIDAPATGLVVVRRCGDVAELLSAALAGLADLAVVSADLDDVDLTVLDRLTRAGTRGVLLVEAEEVGRWSVPGWEVLDAAADPAQVRALLQLLGRQEPAVAGTEDGAPPGDAQRGAAPWDGAPLGQAPWDGMVSGGASWDAAPRHAALGPMTGQGADAAGAGSQEDGRQLEAPPPPPPPQEELAAPWSAAPGPAGPAGVPGQPGAAAPAGVPGQTGTPGRLAVVWGPHGAPGRSTVAAALASGLAAVGPAILVDADTEAPSLAQMLSLPDGSAALATAARLASRSHLDSESFARLLVPLAPSVGVLPGLGRSGRWRELPVAAMGRVWELCREQAAWTVVDVSGGLPEDEVDSYTLEPGPGALRAALLREADVVVVVGGADPVGIRRLLQLLADVAEEGRVGGRLEVVVNRVRSSAAGPAPQRAVREALSRFGDLEEAVLLPQDEAADACLLAGTSVLDGAATTPLGRGLAVLVDRVDPAAGARSRASSARRAGWWAWARRSSSAGASEPPPVPSSLSSSDPAAASVQSGAVSRRAASRSARRRRGGRHRG